MNLSYHEGLKNSQTDNSSIILLGIVVGIFIGLGSLLVGQIFLDYFLSVFAVLYL